MNSQTPTTCPRCGKALAPGATHGLCPACLMAEALASGTVFGVEGKTRVAAAPSPEEIAGKFPQFEILERLGRGGMGVVYKARQKSLNRVVALKILAPEREHDARFAGRFAREAELLAKLSHPHIVTIHDFGQADGLFYIVMEFVDGVNLRDLLRAGKIEPRQALVIVPPVCEALQYAHGHGVVHRDIKPENLLLDREGRVKIADFGIAALVGGDGAGGVGERAGTPPYMAPEQGGEKPAADHRADIYALGVVLYEMLTGERPGREVVAPSRKVQIDVRLDEIVLRALERQPELRYASATEFKTRVETVAKEGAAPAGNRGGRKRSSFGKRVLGGCLAMLLAGLVVVIFLNRASARANEFPRHQIPGGYEGFVVLVYDQPGFPTLPEDGRYQILRYPEDGVLLTSSSPRFGLNADQVIETYEPGSGALTKKLSSWSRYESGGTRTAADGLAFSYLVKAMGSPEYWRTRNVADYRAKIDEAERKLRARGGRPDPDPSSSVLPPVDQGQAAFSPVTERDLPFGDDGFTGWLDLDSGEYPHADFPSASINFSRNGTLAATQQLVVESVPGEQWGTLTAMQVREAIENTPFRGFTGDSGRGDGLPGVWLFKTIKGGMGILQITGLPHDPRGVKIRYKRVRDASAPDTISKAARSASAAIEPALAGYAEATTDPSAGAQKISITIVGSVGRPGAWTVRAGATLLDALAAAGGWTSEAPPTRVRIEGYAVRDARPPTRVHDLDAILAGRAPNPSLRPGDAVRVE